MAWRVYAVLGRVQTAINQTEKAREAFFRSENCDLFECISRRRSAWCTKAELSDRADSETPKEATPTQPIYYIGLDVHKKKISYCVKDGSGQVYKEGEVPATRWDLDRWMHRGRDTFRFASLSGPQGLAVSLILG